MNKINESTLRTIYPQPDPVRTELIQELHEFANAYKHGREHEIKARLTQAIASRNLDDIRRFSKQLREIINTPAPAVLWRDLNLCTWSGR